MRILLFLVVSRLKVNYYIEFNILFMFHNPSNLFMFTLFLNVLSMYLFFVLFIGHSFLPVPSIVPEMGDDFAMDQFCTESHPHILNRMRPQQ